MAGLPPLRWSVSAIQNFRPDAVRQKQLIDGAIAPVHPEGTVRNPARSSPLPTIDGMSRELADVRDREPPSLSLLRTRRDEIMRIAVRGGGSMESARVFGSVARGDAGPDSDVDLLVDFDQRHHGLDLLASQREVEELIGYRVEVGTEVHPSVRERVGFKPCL